MADIQFLRDLVIINDHFLGPYDQFATLWDRVTYVQDDIDKRRLQLCPIA